MSRIVSAAVALLLSLSLFANLNDYALAEEKKDEEREGRVYWLSSHIESNQALQLLAQKYSDETSKKIEIVTVHENIYQTTLNDSLSDEDEAPSLFEIRGWEDIKLREKYLYDLKDTDAVKQLTTTSFNLTGPDGQILAVPCCVDSFGIIVNTGLLSIAGYSVDDICDYSSFKRIAEDIHTRSYSLGFDAFTSSPLTEASKEKYVAQTANTALYYESSNSGTWRETPAAISGVYLDNYKNLWDLYIKNSPYKARTYTTENYDPLDEFGNYRAVFFQGTSHDYDALVNIYGMYDGELAIIPMFSSSSGEENLGLGCGCDSYWAINKNAKKEDIEATKDFLVWMLTDTYSTELLSRSLGALPYKAAKSPVNVFLAQALEDIKAGKTIPHKAYEFIPNMDEWCAQLIPALEQYNNDPADYAWEQVRKAFIDSWSEQFILKKR